MRVHHFAGFLAAIVTFAMGATALRQGTWAVGGSDSACYGLMAKSLARGQLQPTSELARQSPWSEHAGVLAPAGFVASPVRNDAASPVCAPGFSLLLVPFVWLGGLNGIFWATPIAAALLVWLAFVAGRRLAGPWAGLLASVLVATSPIVLYQAMQPMNDVMTAMLWLAVIVAASTTGNRGVVTAGLLTGLAVLVRPNLLPVAVAAAAAVPFVARSFDVRPVSAEAFGGPRRNETQSGEITQSPNAQDGADNPQRRSWIIDVLKFSAAILPGLLIVTLLNVKLYGAAWKSGYGDLAQLFSVAYIPTNLARYSRWILETQTALPFLAFAAPLVCGRERRGLVVVMLAMIVATSAVYAVYRPFEDWWYLRFLLPAVVLALVLAAVTAAAVADRVHKRATPIFCCGLAVIVGLTSLKVADRRLAFSLDVLERRFRDTGLVVRDRLPQNAVLFTVWQSGTVRFYSDRPTILWDALDSSQLDPALAWLRDHGLTPYFLVERNEEPQFRQRFEGVSRVGPLDWPPLFDIDRQARIFDPADRQGYLKGENVRTEYVWGK